MILFPILLNLLTLFKWIVILYILFSYLLVFGIVNPYDRIVWTLGNILNRIIEPVLSPLRQVIPTIGNVDVSPIVLFLIIDWIVRPLLINGYSYFSMQGF